MVSALEGKEKSGKLRRWMAHLDLQLYRGETPNNVMSSPLDSGTLPKCQVVTCVQSVEKLLAIVLKLEMNGLCSSMERAD